MLLGIAGVTGVGKSYYKKLLADKLGFKMLNIITTRPARNGEKNGEDKTFFTPDEFRTASEHGDIAYQFEMCDNLYAYTNSDFSNTTDNIVGEIHYEIIFDLKKIAPHLQTIYLLPSDITIAQAKTCERHFSPTVEKQRLAELNAHYQRYQSEPLLRQAFDYTFVNHYDARSDAAFLALVTSLLEKSHA